MSYNNELLDRFIEMATEASDYAKDNYGDLGKIIIVMENESRDAVIINSESTIDFPKSTYIDFVDKFNQYIWPKYTDIENISFRYFGNIRDMNIMIAFMTQVLVDLRVFADEIGQEETTINDLCDLAIIAINLEHKLLTKLDLLILQYINNYDITITNIDQFINKYEEHYNYLCNMIDKVIENM